MNHKLAPPLNLENLTCVIHCCAYPSTVDKGDDGDEDNMNDAGVNRDGQQDSSALEKDLHRPEKPTMRLLFSFAGRTIQSLTRVSQFAGGPV